MIEPGSLGIIKTDCKYPEVLRTVRMLIKETEMENRYNHPIPPEEKEAVVRGAIQKMGEFIPLILDIPQRMSEGSDAIESRKEKLKSVLENVWQKVPEFDIEAVRPDIRQVNANELKKPLEETVDFLCGYLRDRSPAVRGEALLSLLKLKENILNKTITLTHLNWSCACDPDPDNRNLARDIINSFLFDDEENAVFDHILLFKNAAQYADAPAEIESIDAILAEAKSRIGSYDWHMGHLTAGLYDIPALGHALRRASSEIEQATIIDILAKIAEETPADDYCCVIPLFYALRHMKNKNPVIDALERYNTNRNDELVMAAFIAIIQNENCSDSPMALRTMRALETCIGMDSWGVCELIVKNPETPPAMRKAAEDSRYAIWKKLVANGKFDGDPKNWPNEIRINWEKLEAARHAGKRPQKALARIG